MFTSYIVSLKDLRNSKIYESILCILKYNFFPVMYDISTYNWDVSTRTEDSSKDKVTVIKILCDSKQNNEQ
jgi:hypothetical protein